MADSKTITTYFAGENDLFLKAVEENRGGLRRIVAELAPAAAATDKFNKTQSQLDAALSRGRINLEQHAELVKRLTLRHDEAVKSFQRTTQASGQMRNGLQQVSYNLNDIAQGMANNTPIQTIFIQQSGQMIQALQLMGGEAKGVLGVLAGGWGFGIATATAVLLPFVGKIFESSDALGKAVSKMKEDADQAALTSQAHDVFTKSLEGQREAARLLDEQLQKGLKTQQDEARATYVGAQNHLTATLRLREEYAARLDLARADAEAIQAAGQTGSPAWALAKARLADINKLIAENEKDIAATERNIVNLGSEMAEKTAGRDRAAQITEQYAQMAANIRQAMNANTDFQKSLERMSPDERAAALARERLRIESQISALYAERDRKLRAEQDRQRAENRATRTKKQVFDDFEAELRARGVEHAAGRYGLRSAEDQNAQFRAGLSPLDGYRHPSRHQSYQAFDPSRATQDDQAAYAAAQAAGLKGFRIVNETGGRKHYEWSGAGNKGDVDVAGGTSVARAEETARQKAIAEAQTFATEQQRLRDQLITAMRKTATTEEERYRLAQQDINGEAAAREAGYKSQVSAGKLSEVHAQQLMATSEALRIQLLTNTKMGEMERLIGKDFETRAGMLQMLIDRLDTQNLFLRGDLAEARTQAERRRIQLLILNNETEEERLSLLKVQRLSRADSEEYQRAQRRLDQLGEEKRQKAGEINRGTMGPLEAWLDKVPRTAAEFREELEGIEVRGLDSAADDMAQMVTNALKLHGELGQVTEDLIRIVLKMIEARAINMFGGSSGKKSSGESAISAVLGLLKLGGSIKGDLGDFKGSIPGLAGGGSFMVGGMGGIDSQLLSIGGKPRAMVSPDERIHVTPANDRAGNDSRPIELHIYGDEHANIARIEAVSTNVTVRHMAAAGSAMAFSRRRTIPA